MISFRRFCDSQQSPAKAKFWKMKIYDQNYNWYLDVHMSFLLLLLNFFSYFYLIKMKNLPHSKPYFGLFFWSLKFIKTLFTYFYHKIKLKLSIDGTLSPNYYFHFQEIKSKKSAYGYLFTSN